jgi:catechol 2,3-dioxygenase-like lactoylglutathione lyase family enzyme
LRQSIQLTALLVDEYDRAIEYFTQVLGFTLAEDRPMGGAKRWVVVRPPGSAEGGLLLARAADQRQKEAIGNQSGGRVFLFLQTDNFTRDHEAFTARGVKFLEEPRHEAYGSVAVFEDLYGNRWDLIELNQN